MTIGAAALGAALLAMPAAPAAWDVSPGMTLAFAPLWQPPEGAQRRLRRRRMPATTPDLGGTSSKSTEALEREVFGPGTGIGASASASGGSSNGTRARAEATPSLRRSASARPGARSDEDDDEEDDDEPSGHRSTDNLSPVIAPHMVSFALGTALMGRSFKFDAPLQPESTFPRGGVSAELESFPLLSRDGWFSRLGVGASFSTESGSSGINLTDGGTLSYPATQRRWSFDVRYALPIGVRFLVVPVFGYGRSGYDLERRAQPAPSTCAATSTQVCVPDVQISHLTIGFDARAALTPTLAVSLGAAFLPGFGLGRGPGQLGAESDASTSGFSGSLAVSWQIMHWMALRAAVPLIRYDYEFSGSARPLSYNAASETYYGVVLGATVFTR